MESVASQRGRPCHRAVLYLYVNSAVLMATAEIGFSGVVGANFFISGSIVLTAALMTAIVASGNKNIAKWALPVLAVRHDGRLGDDQSRRIAPDRTPATDHAIQRS